jgi:hypothetical protein
MLLRIGAGVAVIVLIYQVLFGRRADFVIRVKHGRVAYTGKVPLSLQHDLTSFLLEDLSLTNPVRILGSRQGARTIVWFRGRISPAEQQRIRNFLTLHA